MITFLMKEHTKNNNDDKKNIENATENAQTNSNKNESEMLLQLPLQIYGTQHMRPNNNNTTIKDDSQKSLFRLSSTIVECYCRIELKFVWYVSLLQFT